MSQNNLIKGPLVTEKVSSAGSTGRYAFSVDPSASKRQVKQAVEKMFSVKVLSVKTIKSSGKKKAIVQLASDQKITLFETGK